MLVIRWKRRILGSRQPTRAHSPKIDADPGQLDSVFLERFAPPCRNKASFDHDLDEVHVNNRLQIGYLQYVGARGTLAESGGRKYQEHDRAKS